MTEIRSLDELHQAVLDGVEITRHWVLLIDGSTDVFYTVPGEEFPMGTPNNLDALIKDTAGDLRFFWEITQDSPSHRQEILRARDPRLDKPVPVRHDLHTCPACVFGVNTLDIPAWRDDVEGWAFETIKCPVCGGKGALDKDEWWTVFQRLKAEESARK